jgi:hypothetical protein
MLKVCSCPPLYLGIHSTTILVSVELTKVKVAGVCTKEITQYNKQTYTLSELQSDTWYELRLFAENKFDKSSVTDIQSISTRPSIEKGMACRESVFCFLIFSIFYAKVGGGRYHISNHLTKITLILR